MSATAPIKETKAQRVERLKREFNPWDGLNEIRRFSQEGFDAIPPQWVNTYFRWWGVYTQGDGIGAVGGKGGEGKALPYFMLRIRIPSGHLFAHQLRTVASLCREHARSSADITVRQNIQFHWVSIESLPTVLEKLWGCGLNSMGACGDVTRNVTGCPVAGLDADELCDATSLVQKTAAMLVGNPSFYNLPRKHKISIAGCTSWCAYPEINDIGLTAVRNGGDVGFSLRVGGGLSTEPHLAARLNVFVREHQVLSVVRGVTEIFNDAEVLRQNRERARLKYLFLQHGWTPDRFREELERRIGFALENGVEETPPVDVVRDHVGVHAQRQPGLHYIGACVVRGRISPEQMEVVADLADRFGNGEVRTTIMQNIIIPNVRTADVQAVCDALGAAGLPVDGSVFGRGAVACTGTEFCKLAVAETKSFTRWLVDCLDERLPGFDQQLKIHVTGCPNSCGQHWIADIGLEGKKLKVDGKMIDAYYFFLGGSVGAHAGFGRKTGYRCAASDVPAAIERLARRYQADRHGDENLRSYLARHREDELRSILAGAAAPEEARDEPLDAAPVGVDG